MEICVGFVGCECRSPTTSEFSLIHKFSCGRPFKRVLCSCAQSFVSFGLHSVYDGSGYILTNVLVVSELESFMNVFCRPDRSALLEWTWGHAADSFRSVSLCRCLHILWICYWWKRRWSRCVFLATPFLPQPLSCLLSLSRQLRPWLWLKPASLERISVLQSTLILDIRLEWCMILGTLCRKGGC